MVKSKPYILVNNNYNTTNTLAIVYVRNKKILLIISFTKVKGTILVPFFHQKKED